MPIRIDTLTADTILVTAVSTPTVPWILWHVGPMRTKKGDQMPIEVSMTSEEQVRLAIQPMTAAGNPAPVDGPAQWSVEGACTVVPIDDTSAWIISGASMGDSTVTVA